MQATIDSEAGSADETVMVWIEDGAGAITRGRAASTTATSAQVRLTGRPSFAAGDAVALRISFEPGAPTVALAARVAWVRSVGDATECSLKWVAPGEPLKRLDVR